MRAFLTGATGFLGSRVLERMLARGYQVRALVRQTSDSSGLTRPGVELVHGELGSFDREGDGVLAEALEGCAIVVHAGARVETSGQWDLFHKANVEGTHQLLATARKVGVGRFVHVSSLGIFDIPASGVRVGVASDYDHEPRLRGHYTRSKIHGDRVVAAAIRLGAPAVIVRPGILYGPGRPLYRGRVSRGLGSILLVVVGSADYRPPLCYVDNAADAVMQAAEQPGANGGMFNVVDDPDLTHERYFRLLAARSGMASRVLFVPVSMLAPALKAVETAFKLLGRRRWAPAYQLRRADRNAIYETDATTGTLAWHPAVGLDEALERSVEGAA